MTSSAFEATEEMSSVIYLRIDESLGSFGWEIRRYDRAAAVLTSDKRFTSDAIARKDGLPAFIRYASQAYL